MCRPGPPQFEARQYTVASTRGTRSVHAWFARAIGMVYTGSTLGLPLVWEERFGIGFAVWLELGLFGFACRLIGWFGLRWVGVH